MAKTTLKEAGLRIRSSIMDLKGDADKIAIALWRAGVRHAVCGNETRCALAQHFANQLPKGFYVSVDGSFVMVSNSKKIQYDDYGEPQNVVEIALPERLAAFVSAFDSREYMFLNGKKPTKKAK